MESELERAIQVMGENLSGMAERFSADYQPLLESVRKVVEIGKQSERDE